jgi:hypothetical protein
MLLESSEVLTRLQPVPHVFETNTDASKLPCSRGRLAPFAGNTGVALEELVLAADVGVCTNRFTICPTPETDTSLAKFIRFLSLFV